MSDANFVEPQSLVRYLIDLARLRRAAITDVKDYRSVLWLDDVPEHPKVRCSLGGQTAEQISWLVVDRVQLPQLPELDSDLEPWLAGVSLDRPGDEPEIHVSITVAAERDTGDGPMLESIDHLLSDHPDLEVSWASYLDRWRVWSAQRQALDPVHSVYTQLFRVAEVARQVGEQVETVMAVGLLLVAGENGLVRRHLLTAPAQVTLDAESGRITVEPATDLPPRMTLEQDMVAPSQTPPVGVQTQIRELLKSEPEPLSDPLDFSAVTPLLTRWAQGASAEGHFDAELSPGPTSTRSTHPVIRLAPALILRPRSQAAIVETYNEMLAAIEAGEEVPATFGDLTTIQSGELTAQERLTNGLELSGEQWFPLPSNAEQAQIVEALRTRRGVIVHGPPGTGKSHTIANLISHAMAMGQRVLVTSHSARALEVLADKLPDDIRALTVTMLGQGRRGTDDLENSANEILRRRQDPNWKPGEISDRLAELQDRLGTLRARRSQLLKKLGELRMQETNDVDLGFGGYSGTRASIAQTLAVEPPAPEWLTVIPATSAPLSASELNELTSARNRLSQAQLTTGRLKLLPESSIPTTEIVVRAINEFVQLGDLVDGFEDVSAEVIAAVDALDPQISTELARLLRTQESAQRSLNQRQSPWLIEAAQDLQQGNTAVWRSLLDRTSEFLASSAHFDKFDSIRVEIDSNADRFALRLQSAVLLSFFEGGGTIRRFGALDAKPVKDARELFETVRVDGAVPDNLATCQVFVEWCDAVNALEVIDSCWPPGVLAPSPNISQRRAILIDAHSALESVFANSEAAEALAGFVAGNAVDLAVVPSTVRALERAVAAAEAHRRLGEVKAELLPLHGLFRDFADLAGSHQVNSDLADAIASCDAAAYYRVSSQLDALYQLHTEVVRFDRLLTRLSRALPEAAKLLISGSELSELAALHEHWDRARARKWLDDLDRPDANSASRAVAETDDEIRSVIRDIGANRAWLSGLGRLTEMHTQHLKGYQSAMKRVGKGNSKYDYKYRAEARSHLAECHDAIPAWVMPAHQVAASMPRVAGLFDLVVIDEASQSGVEELFLFWLGKQVVVVGDKQQISPEGSFVKRGAMDLQRRHLDGWSFAGDFGPENSLFDVAEVKYVQGEVWLSEHFRSMPEIIEYSNKLCYADHRLEPVRQFGADRLPPLRRTYVPFVPDGIGAGSASKTNRDEAEAIVAQIIDCVTDPAYVRADGTPMTMGVISLLGPAQANLIQQRLLAELDTQTLSERHLHVGDAADFQGDERDIIFLSMVKTPSGGGVRVPKLGHDRDSRRFNVAASRARDQLWLFHSLTLDELRPDCPRARLISHMDHPGLEGLEGFERPLDPNHLTPPFESLFEQRVFIDLRNRGFVIRPQWKVLGYRIDLVVTGADARLAIEVDGDRWHGPDRYADDLARQSDLERVGWRIVRIKEWEYYSDKARALAPVFKALEELNIGPGATRLREPVAQPRTVPAATVAEEFAAEDETDESVEKRSWFEEEADDRDDSAETAEGEPTPTVSPERPLPSIEVNEAPLTARTATGLLRYSKIELTSAPEPTSIPPASLGQIILEVVRVEGPVVAERVYQVINIAAGNQRVGPVIRAAMQKACDGLQRAGLLLAEDPLSDGPLLATLRLPDQPAVLRRERGPRLFQHVPPREIAAMIEHERSESESTGVEVYRRIHRIYDHQRMRDAAIPRYVACERLIDSLSDQRTAPR